MIDHIFKKVLGYLFNRGAERIVISMFSGALILYIGNKLIEHHESKIISEIMVGVNRGDSLTRARIMEVGQNNNYNTILTIERLSSLEDTIYHDNKALRKENQNLLNEKYRLEQEKSTMLEYQKKTLSEIYLDSIQCLTSIKIGNGT